MKIHTHEPGLNFGVKHYRFTGGSVLSPEQQIGKAKHRKVCKTCRRKIRGKNHDQGAHHNNTVRRNGTRY